MIPVAFFSTDFSACLACIVTAALWWPCDASHSAAWMLFPDDLQDVWLSVPNVSGHPEYLQQHDQVKYTKTPGVINKNPTCRCG